MSLFYSLFVFRLCYKIIGFSKLSGPQAYPSLARRYWPGLGLNSSLWAWAGLEKLLRGRAWTLTANCGPGLGSNSRPAQGTSFHQLVVIVDLQVAQKFRVLYIYPLRTEMMADPAVQIHFLRCSSVLCKFYPTETPDGYISEGYVSHSRVEYI